MDLRFIYIDRGRKNGNALYLDVGLKVRKKPHTFNLNLRKKLELG